MKNKVLIVEDNELIAYLTESYLKENGYHVLPSTSSAEEAINIVKTKNPDYVIMDIRTEGNIDGIDAAIILNRSNNFNSIIFISGNSEEATMNRVIKTGHIAFLQKPVRKEDLLEILKNN